MSWRSSVLAVTQRANNILFYGGTAITFTNASAAFTELNTPQNNRRLFARLQGCRWGLIYAGGAGTPAGTTLAEVQYSLDNSSYSTLGTAPYTTGMNIGTAFAIPNAARFGVYLRCGLSGGDAAGDPTVGHFGMLVW